ncbi:MAG TPA: metallophosphoesterase [Ktedonobacteraceae bacterium]|nr:metallophosphoesterase [Ktedonobacteraceae bacterium]
MSEDNQDQVPPPDDASGGDASGTQDQNSGASGEQPGTGESQAQSQPTQGSAADGGQDAGAAASNPAQPRRFGNPLAAVGHFFANIAHPIHPNTPFQPLPAPTGSAPYHLSLEAVLPAEQVATIRAAERLMFHTAGDTGGIKSPQPQKIVADHMTSDYQVTDATARPAFFYHLGDVVYFTGEGIEYFNQFYDPYDHYPSCIFAIPGNHDGDIMPDSDPSLAAFVRNFCTTTPAITKDAGEAHRDSMTQPNVYWTLEAPFATIIGLYSNVPEGGKFDDTQIAWFESELANAPTDKALLLAVHHPAYSADQYHAGSKYIQQVLEQAFTKSGRVPDAVFSGHVHNYQRFTASFNGRDVPFLVVGAGGYWNLHSMQKGQDGNALLAPLAFPELGVTLESFCADHHGYMQVEVTPQTLKGEYYSVPRPQESWSAPAKLIDSFTLDLQTHHLVIPTVQNT